MKADAVEMHIICAYYKDSVTIDFLSYWNAASWVRYFSSYSDSIRSFTSDANLRIMVF